MSWYTDTQLFIVYGTDSQFYVRRVTKEYGSSPIAGNDLKEYELLSFSKHLSLGNNKESDFDAFKASFKSGNSGNQKYINSQGFVINFASGTGTWTREEQNTPFWSLPGITKQKSFTELLADKQALEGKVSDLEGQISSLHDEVNNSKVEKESLGKRVFDLESENSILGDEVNNYKKDKEANDERILFLEAEISNLRAEINRQRDEKILAGLDALEKQVSDLTSKLVQCCGATEAGSSVEEPWFTIQTVPSNWVPFKDLDVQAFSKNIPLTITKAKGGPRFGDDNTTNVQANFFYRGMYPIVVVNIEELTPNREDARFDPDVWSLYNNAGISYAARKPFPSEMSIDEYKSC